MCLSIPTTSAMQQYSKISVQQYSHGSTNEFTGINLFQKNASTMLVDSGATSHFMRAEEKLPITGASTKVVFLPNGSTINASHKTELPFPSLSKNARQALKDCNRIL
jgi:hypothetical protein